MVHWDLQKVLGLGEPLATSMGFEIVKAEFATEPGGTVLRIFLDRMVGGPITLEDCESFSRNLGPILDVEGGLPGRYHLEISSPGLDRPLVSPKHFRAQIGKIVDIQTVEATQGRRHFKGELRGVEGDMPSGAVVTLEVEGKEYQIPLREIKKAHLDYFASEERTKTKR